MNEREAHEYSWKIEMLEAMRLQAKDSNSLAAKQVYINGLEFELEAALASQEMTNWEYYQDLLKQNGFDGITDLLAQYKKLQVASQELVGWQLVPIEPTKQMIDAYLKTGLAQTFYHDAYKAMLNAAPSPEQAKQEPVYQVQVTVELWNDVSKELYDNWRIPDQCRILYKSPPNQAALIAELVDALETCEIIINETRTFDATLVEEARAKAKGIGQ
jgi:hypothetical protein